MWVDVEVNILFILLQKKLKCLNLVKIVDIIGSDIFSLEKYSLCKNDNTGRVSIRVFIDSYMYMYCR